MVKERSLTERAGFSFFMAGLFFLSGACGLIYEMAWTRMLTVVAGGATRALTAVLVAYMSGLALGSFLAGRWVDRRGLRPVLAYGVLEGGIGVCALVLSAVIPALVPVLKLGRSLFGEQSLLFDLYRFAVSALALVVPTTLMGATFPVLFRGLLGRRERFGFTSGLLYVSNTLGAVAGSLGSAFFLIPALGFRAATWAAAAVNFFLCFLVLAFRSLRERRVEAEVLRRRPEEKGESARLWRVVAAGYGLSGLAAMIYQVGWARALSLSLGNSTYALGLIFAAYIGGLALGGLLITPVVDRLRRPLLWAAGLEAGIALSALLFLPLFEVVTARMFNWSLAFRESFRAFQGVRFLAAFLLILLPTLAMGALFPVVVRLGGRLRAGAGEPTGIIYAANTLGAIVGAFLAGHVLIRGLGVHASLLAATGLSALIGTAWIFFSDLPPKTRSLTGSALLSLSALAMLLTPGWDPILMNSGPYMYAEVFQEQLKRGEDIREVLSNYYDLRFHEEDMECTVSVLEFLASRELYLRINGKTDASSHADMPSQVLCAQLPLLLHPDPKKVMMLGLASGVSAGSVLLHPVEKLDCVEISPAVARASRLFADLNRLPQNDPRFHLILDDARNFLALSNNRYDVIIIESTNPWIAGISALFTREFFNLLAEHLTPRGLALIFIPVYDLNADTVKMVLRTFGQAFPYCTLWESIPNADYFVIGSREPFAVDPDRFLSRARNPAVKEDLARIKVFSGLEIFARFVMGPERFNRAKGEGELHLDDRRQLEYVAPRLMEEPWAGRLLRIVKEVLVYHEPATSLFSPFSPPLAEDQLALLQSYDRAREAFYQAVLRSLSTTPEHFSFDGLLRSWREVMAICAGRFPCDTAAKEMEQLLTMRGEEKLRAGDEKSAAEDFFLALELNPDSSLAADTMIEYHLPRGNDEEVRKWAEKALAHLPGDAIALLALGQLELKANRPAKAEPLLRELVRVIPASAASRFLLGLSLARQKRLMEAETELHLALESDPRHVDSLFLLSEILITQGRRNEAKKYLNRARKLAPSHPKLKELTAK